MLKTIDIFACLDEHVLATLERAAVRKKFPKNTLLFSRGDISDSLYVIIEGKVKAVLYNEDGKEILFSIFGPGDYFGELGVLDGEPRTASLVTKTSCKVLILKKRDLDTIIFDNVAMSTQLLKKTLIKLREATLRIENLTFMNVYGRIVNLLLQLADKQAGGVLSLERLTHQEIANMVGASREMASRIMKELHSTGYIEIDDRRIAIRKKFPTSF
jgi:CRP/FNR family transcriptional regulator, cyclic AMP receptor protein